MTRVGNRVGSETLQTLCVFKQQSIHAVKREKQDSELGLVATSFARPNAGHGEGFSAVISKSGLQVVRWSTKVLQIMYSRRLQIRINLIPALVKNSR